MTVSPTGHRIVGQPAGSCLVIPSVLHEASLVKPFTTCRQARARMLRSPAQRYSRVQCQQQQRAEPELPNRRRLLTGVLAGNAMMLAATCPCCTQMAQAAEGAGFGYGGGDAGPAVWPGTCSIGMQQSPINVPLAEHLAHRQSGNGKKKKVGNIKFSYETKQSDVGEFSFEFEQEINASGDVKFDFDQNVDQFGSIKFKFEQKFDQKLNRYGDIKFKYPNQMGAKVLNSGHGTMQVNAPKGNMSSVAGRDLELVQWHFHTPSEHAFDWERKAMEVHLVHKDTQTGGLAVVAVLLQEGTAPPNPAVQFALNLAPELHAPERTADQQSMQVNTLLPQPEAGGQRPYIHYVGSLTTPPCSEDVQWFIFADTVTIPGSQVDQFQQFASKANGVPANARPLQPLNNRSFDFAEFL